jgi:Rrf2 family transcriptional regulator, iron-sulfur cluster assembly transcription factor
MLSNTSKYAIRAVIYLALNAGEERKIGIKEISKDLKIPTPFLGKILQTLAKHKLLSSTKGPHGGFGLGKAAEDIYLLDIVDIIDGQDIFKKCLIRLDDCSEDKKDQCSLHDKYLDIRKSLMNLFQHEKISELVDEIKAGKRTENI